MDPPVGVYMDGVYLGRTAGSTFDLIDIERMEVLRGPQGTLFGRNTSGGAISVTSRRPGDAFGGRTSLELGERDLVRGTLTLDVPIADSLNTRLSLLKSEQDGWVDRLFDGGTAGDVDTVAGRLVVDWAASDKVQLLLSADYSDSDNSPVPQATEGVLLPSASLCPRFCIPLPADMNDQASPAYDKTWTANPSLNKLEIFGTHAVLDWDMGAVSLKSITAYRDLEQTTTADYDVTAYAFYDDLIPLEQEQFSQELQLSGLAMDDRIQWLAGAYYYKEEVDQTNGITLGATGPLGVLDVPFGIELAPGVTLPLVPLVVDPPIPGDRGQRIVNRQNILPQTESWALFGSASIALSERWSMSLGLRYSEDEKEQQYRFLNP